MYDKLSKVSFVQPELDRKCNGGAGRFEHRSSLAMPMHLINTALTRLRSYEGSYVEAVKLLTILLLQRHVTDFEVSKQLSPCDQNFSFENCVNSWEFTNALLLRF